MNTITATITVPVQSLTEATKAGLLTYADTLVNTYVAEGYDVLNLMAEAAKLELLASRIKDKAKEVSVSEVCKYGRSGIAKLGVSMTVKEVGVTYDYSLDPVWQYLNQAVIDATAKRKEQESLLRSLPYGGRLMVDEQTGEEYRAYPPAKMGGDGVVISIQ